MENVCCKIERLRQEMHLIALKKGISHVDALRASQHLDVAINEFYNIGLIRKAG